ncbi:MAG: 50S ribosomal protein L17 [Thermodesulfobacteriota bacterium]
MKHRKAGLKLGRTASHRTALFRNMVTSLLKYQRIQTTDTKAKELKRWADNIITLAKRGDLHARRQALSIVREKDVVNKLFAEAAERFGSRAGGYTRVVKIGRRSGDAAPVSIIELIAAEKTKTKDKKPKKKKGTKTAKPKTRKEKEVAAETASAVQDEKSKSEASEKTEDPSKNA